MANQVRLNIDEAILALEANRRPFIKWEARLHVQFPTTARADRSHNPPSTTSVTPVTN